MRTMILATVLMVLAGCDGAQQMPQAQQASAPLMPSVGPSGETEWTVSIDAGDRSCAGSMALIQIEPYGCGAIGQVGHWVCSGPSGSISGYLSGHAIGGVENMTFTAGGAPTFGLTGSFGDSAIRGIIPELGGTFRADRQ